MSRTRVELNIPGFNEVRKSPEMVAILGEHSARILSSVGDGYAARSRQMGSRAIEIVTTTNWDAYRNEKKNNSLLKAVSG